MTAIVGILCNDGVVLGTDSSATFAQGRNRTIEQPFEKIEIIGDHIIMAGTGQIGLSQRFCKIVQDAWDAKCFNGHPIDCVKNLCQKAITDFISTNAAKGEFGALVAFPISGKPYLCEFSVTDFQPELKTEHLWYCSMGSAQPITDTLLAFMRDIFWGSNLPSVAEAIFCTLWTLEMAIQINPGGVNGPVRMATLSNDKKGHPIARLLSANDLAEMHEALEVFKKDMQNLRDKFSSNDSTKAPPTFDDIARQKK